MNSMLDPADPIGTDNTILLAVFAAIVLMVLALTVHALFTKWRHERRLRKHYSQGQRWTDHGDIVITAGTGRGQVYHVRPAEPGQPLTTFSVDRPIAWRVRRAIRAFRGRQMADDRRVVPSQEYFAENSEP
jgi:hypothetical protein